MSSQDDEPSPPHVSEPEQVKRKKKQRACDYCRRKKSEHNCSCGPTKVLTDGGSLSTL